MNGTKLSRTEREADRQKERWADGQMGMGATRAARLLVVPEAITHPKKKQKRRKESVNYREKNGRKKIARKVREMERGREKVTSCVRGRKGEHTKCQRVKTFINHVKVTTRHGGVKRVWDIVEFIDINYNSNYNSKFGRLIAVTLLCPLSAGI